MKYLITIFLLAQAALYAQKSFAQVTNLDNSPYNMQNSPYNMDNSTVRITLALQMGFMTILATELVMKLRRQAE